MARCPEKPKNDFKRVAVDYTGPSQAEIELADAILKGTKPAIGLNGKDVKAYHEGISPLANATLVDDHIAYKITFQQQSTTIQGGTTKLDTKQQDEVARLRAAKLGPL